MSSNSSGKKLEGFFTGKGFYIVLFLCAAVIGVSAWMMAAGDVAMKNEVPVRSNVNMENKRVETVIIPAETAAPAAEAPVFGEAEPVTGGDEEIAAEAPEISAEGINAPVSEPEDIEAVDVWKEGDVMEVAAPMYVWPLSGELEHRGRRAVRHGSDDRPRRRHQDRIRESCGRARRECRRLGRGRSHDRFRRHYRNM